MSSRGHFLQDPISTIRHGATNKTQPDVILSVVHDADAEKFLEAYPEITEPYKNDPEVLDNFCNLERDLGSYDLALITAKELIKISRGKLRIDLLSVAEIPRAVIDANRVPQEDESFINPSGVHISPIRRVFGHKEYPELVKEFQEIHQLIINEVDKALASLPENGLFLDIHTMNSHDSKNSVQEGPNAEALKKYIDIFTLPENQSRPRNINLLTRFIDQPIIANQELVRHLEQGVKLAGMSVERDYPYSYLDFSMCSQYALRYKGKGTTIDIPIGKLSKDGKADNINPELAPEKIMLIAKILAKSIHSTMENTNSSN